MKQISKDFDISIDSEMILNAFHEDIVVVNSKGIIIKVSSPSFEKFYGIKAEDAIGKTIYYMEEQKIFNPSVAKIVFETGSKVIVAQKNKEGRSFIITAVPIKDEQDKIKYVVSYSLDITELKIIDDEMEKLNDDLLRYREELEEYRRSNTSIGDIADALPSIHEIYKLISKLTKYDVNVLITGESGVGKTTFARLIHSKSSRADGPFIEISCGAIPDNLLESELFGYEKGAFTGANREGKIGLIEMAQNGTLFLDEISELPLNLQVKLLKTLQDKKIMRVGGTQEIKVDFRLISATNSDLPEQVSKKEFREDLYYRLNVIQMNIPPLRERPEDMLHLITFFMEKFNDQYGEQKRLSSNAFHHLLKYNWPGNIRQMENVIERLVITSESGNITEKDLPEYILGESAELDFGGGDQTYDELIDKFESIIFRDAYKKYKTSVGVAKALGMSQSTAARKLKKYVGQED